MTRAHIQTRVWLSIGIFVLGFLLTTVVSQVERRRAERGLAVIADAVLPAAQHGRRCGSSLSAGGGGVPHELPDRRPYRAGSRFLGGRPCAQIAAPHRRDSRDLCRTHCIRPAPGSHSDAVPGGSQRSIREFPSRPRGDDAGITGPASPPGGPHDHSQGRPSVSRHRPFPRPSTANRRVAEPIRDHARVHAGHLCRDDGAGGHAGEPDYPAVDSGSVGENSK